MVGYKLTVSFLYGPRMETALILYVIAGLFR